VDELGGIDLAIQKARQLANIPTSSRVSLVMYPAKRSLLEYVMQAAGDDDATAMDAMLTRAGLEKVREAMHNSSLRVWMRGGMMRMLPFSFDFH